MIDRTPAALRRLVNLALVALVLAAAACADDGSGEEGGRASDAGTRPPPAMRDAAPPPVTDAGPRPSDAGPATSPDASVASDAGASVATDGGSDECACEPEAHPSERCRELAAECESGTEGACALLESLCGSGSGGGEGVPGDGEAGDGSGGEPCTCADAGAATCEDLLDLCLGGDREACSAYETGCGGDGAG